jgi:hypothetical protein
MNDITLKAQEERQGWTGLSDIVWTAGYLIATSVGAVLFCVALLRGVLICLGFLRSAARTGSSCFTLCYRVG